ncbi:retrovirus-related pol polyprotein from transposon TNT 1-94 [Tanacetum coccineum]
MATMAENVISAGAENRSSMLEKDMYDSWKSRIMLYIEGKENREMLTDSINNGPFKLKEETTIPTSEGVPEHKRLQTLEDLNPKEKLWKRCDIKANNIILLVLLVDIYTFVNHHKIAKEIWDRVKELMEGTELALQERESNLYDDFITMSKTQVNMKFVNHLQPKWSMFVTVAKQAKDLHNVNFDQLYAFLKHKEKDTNKVRVMRQRNTYIPPVLSQQPPLSSTQLDLGFVVPSFLLTDDLIACLNKAMLFLSSMISSRFPPTNNQLRTLSNLRTQAKIQDGRVTIQNVQERQSQGYVVNTGKSQATGTRVINIVGDVNANQPRAIRCYNCKGEGHIAKQCTAKRRVKDSEWFKEKMLLAQA